MKEVYGSMALNTERLYTTKDIMALPDGVRAELIDGNIYYMASPTRIHQALLRELAVTFTVYQKSSGVPCQTLFAPFAVFINQDEFNYLEPDLLVICPKDSDDHRLQNDGCHGAPDFVLEIVSPSSKTMDFVRKTVKYGTSGVREYWIVDPEKERVLVYHFEKDPSPIQYTFDDKIPVGITEGFSVDFKTLNY